MCGIAGFIGRSKDYKRSFDVLTELFWYLDTRGIDASGVWGTEIGEKGRIIYHKEPTRSANFVKTPFWTDLAKIKTNLMIVHARGASQGYGNPSVNKNNHPFVSSDKSIGLAHNGKIYEYEQLKEKFELKSMCDSEILLRIFESAIDEEGSLDSKLKGIQDIWSCIEKGHMAVAIGEHLGKSRNLWLFRNKFRPIWFADLRKTLGQIFFFSSPEIWCDAFRGTDLFNVNLIEMPVDQIWFFKIDLENPMVVMNNYRRFNVKRTDKVFNLDKPKQWIPTKEPKFNIISKMNAEEVPFTKASLPEYVNKSDYPVSSSKYEVANKKDGHWDNGTYHRNPWDSKTEFEDNKQWESKANSIINKIDKKIANFPNNNIENIEELDTQSTFIIKLIQDIVTETTNYAIDGTITSAEYQDILDSLETVKNELLGTKKLLFTGK